MTGLQPLGLSPRFLADAVLLLHAAFVLWVALGVLAVWRWPRLAWLHLPALAWGVWIIGSGGICPLTPLEDELRRAAGEAGYAGGFIEHWVQRLIYPPGLERWHQVAIAAVLVAVNLGVYGSLLARRRRRIRAPHPGPASGAAPRSDRAPGR
jgi:hypothetical protein